MRPFRSFPAMLLRSIISTRRWLLAYVLLILLPASILLYMYSQKASRIVEDEVTRSMLQTMKQASINLDSRFESVIDTSNIILMNPELSQYLDDTASAADQLAAIAGLRNLVDNSGTNPNVFRIRLFVDNAKLYSHERINFFPLDSFKDQPVYQQVQKAGGLIVWLGASKQSYIDAGDQYVYSAARIVKNPNDYSRVSGVLVVDMNARTVNGILNQIELAPSRHLFLVDGIGTVVGDPDLSRLGVKLEDRGLLSAIGGAAEGIVPLKEAGEPTYAIYTTMASTGWRLVAEVPRTAISARALSLNQATSVATLSAVTVLFLALVFLLLAYMVRGMNRRVQTVIRMIKREGTGRLDERVVDAGGSDFNVLERSVDQLIQRVHDLVEETYLTKVQEREAQLRALQAQINPHFLYNTLDTINWIAIGHGARDISQMIDGLARYFRLSLNKGRDLVSIADELELAKVYLEIQMSRFPRSFTFELQVDDELEACLMPKLTLQPIVENALLHGLRKSPNKGGRIRIRAVKEEDEVVLTVQDDGIGMEQEQASRLLSEPPLQAIKPEGAGSSYGLYNVNERIKLFAGAAYGLEIESAPGEGTTVKVRFAARPRA